MHPSRKLAKVLVACAIPLGTVVGLALSSTAGAAVSPHKTVAGTVSCSPVTGSISFSPALTPSGTAKEKSVKVSTSFGTCTDQNNNPVAVNKAVVKVKLGAGSTASCANFATGTSSDSISIKVSYGGGVGSSNITFGPGSVSAVTSGNVGFNATGGTVKGSYAGAASFSVQLASSSATQIENCVTGSGSVSSLQISGGTSQY